MAELLVWIPLDGIGVHDKATECLLLELVCFVLCCGVWILMRSTSVALSEMSQGSIGWIVMKHGADICCPPQVEL